jgi:hypothetical protein
MPPKHYFILTLSLLGLLASPSGSLAEHVTVDLRGQRISADVDGWELKKTLIALVSQTGWEVYLEPGTALSRPASAKFSAIPTGSALSQLLPGMKFTLTSRSNSSRRLLLYRTTAAKATTEIEIKTARLKKQIIVQLKRPSKKTIEEIANNLGAKVVGKIGGINAYRLEFPFDNAALLGRDALLRDDDVAGVDFNYRVNQPPGTRGYDNTTGALAIKPGSGPDGSRTIVALIDTPVQSDVPFSGFLLDSISVAGGDVPASTVPSHGTSMFQSLLRGLDAGVGSQTESSVRVLPIDIYGASEETSTFNVANGIVTAVNEGAAIVNLSLGSTADSQFLHTVIRDANKLGVTFIASAGNEPITDNVYPAAYPEVLAVTAGDRTGAIADYANYGNFVDVVGPGTSIVNYQDANFMVTGTSPASAYMAGVAAGIASTKGANPQAIQAGLAIEYAPTRK